MAEVPVEKIHEQLNCSIYLDTYTDPKILQCFHIYCQKCLVKLVQGQQGQLSLSCPICRQVTPVPASGTDGLQSAFHINRFLEILDQHKKAKAESDDSAERLDIKAESFPPCKNLCSEHEGKELELYCETCEELICYKCALKGGKHHRHDYNDVSASFESFKQKITPSLEPLENKMKAITDVLTQLDSHCDKITDQHKNIEAKIRESSKQLHEAIDKRQDELLNHLAWITRRRFKLLEAQKDQIETLQAQLSSCLEFTRESLKADIQKYEVLVIKARILKQVKELSTAFQPDILKLPASPDMEFSLAANVAEVCSKYGTLYAPESPDPSKSAVTLRDIVIEGEVATMHLNAVSYSGKPCDESVVSLFFEAELVSETTGSKQICSIQSTKKQGLYPVRYQTNVGERYQMNIKADGQHIRNSPLRLYYEYLKTLAS